MKYLQITFILIFLSGFFLKAKAQDTPEIWTKLSPEVTIVLKKLPLEFRIRPDDHIFMPTKYIPNGNMGRTDIMIGAKYKMFKLFSYSKFSWDGKVYTGIRLDYNFKLAENKLFFNIQERMFWGLNKNSKDHYYLVQYIRYAATPKLHIGLLSYGKWKTAPTVKETIDIFNKGYWFIGPSFHFFLPKGFNILFSPTKTAFQKNIYMAFIRLGWKIKL